MGVAFLPSQHFQAPFAVAAEAAKRGHPLFSFPNSKAPLAVQMSDPDPKP